MFKYNKIIVAISIIVCFGGEVCHVTASSDRFDDAERGFVNTIQISHQDTLRQEQLTEYNRTIFYINETNYNT